MGPVKKILYISNPYYLDYDLSLIKNLSDKTNCYYFLDISPISAQATILKIVNFISKTTILDETSYNISVLFKGYLPEGKTFIINRKTNKPSISNFRLQFELTKCIKNIGPDIIHFNTDFNHNYFLLYFLLKIPIIWTIHDPLPHTDDDSIKEGLKRKIFFHFIKNFILLNKKQLNAFISRYKLSKKKVFVSSLGIYNYLLFDKQLPLLKRRTSSDNSVKIIFFGRINMYKGISFLISAFNNIVLKYPEISLIIAGKGDLNDIDRVVTKKIEFINRYIENKELAELIAESDFVVCPYLDATQSGVIMTAFAFAKPVIATDVGGLKDFVEDGVTGLLVQPASSDKLEEAMEKLIRNPELLSQMSQNILDKYHSGENSWKTIARNTLEIYNMIQ